VPIAFPTYLVAGSRKAPGPLNYVTCSKTATCATAGRKEDRGERVFELGTRRSGSLMIVCRIVFCSAHTNSKHTCRSAVRLSPHTVQHIESFTLTTTALRTLGPTTAPPACSLTATLANIRVCSFNPNCYFVIFAFSVL